MMVVVATMLVWMAVMMVMLMLMIVMMTVLMHVIVSIAAERVQDSGLPGLGMVTVAWTLSEHPQVVHITPSPFL